jgi:Thioesterase-like superfamily
MDAHPVHDAVFVSDGSAFQTLPSAGGPWSPSMVQGSASAALLTRCIERSRKDAEWRLARLTFDLWRPVAVAPVETQLRVLREGRKAIFSEATLTQGDAIAARCTALWLRSTPEATAFLDAPSIVPPRPETGRSIPPHIQAWSRFFVGVETRMIEGDLAEMGPASVWFRMQRPLVDSEANSPLMNAVSAADLASGIAAVVDLRKWTFINADLTLHFWREPASEWILVEARTQPGPDGLAQTTATLSDTRGAFGTVAQSILIEPRR